MPDNIWKGCQSGWQTLCGWWKQKRKNGKWTVGLLVAGLLGVALIGLSVWWQPSSQPAAEEISATETYVAQLEERLRGMVSAIDGVGNAQVLVTLENGVEYVYANEQKTNSDRSDSGSGVSQRDDTEQSVVVVDTGDGREGLLVTEIQPTVRGVVVACEGGGNETVAAAVRKAVTTALNITEKRVCVIKSTGKGE